MALTVQWSSNVLYFSNFAVPKLKVYERGCYRICSENAHW